MRTLDPASTLNRFGIYSGRRPSISYHSHHPLLLSERLHTPDGFGTIPAAMIRMITCGIL
jgi:hypothetical protein